MFQLNNISSNHFLLFLFLLLLLKAAGLLIMIKTNSDHISTFHHNAQGSNTSTIKTKKSENNAGNSVSNCPFYLESDAHHSYDASVVMYWSKMRTMYRADNDAPLTVQRYREALSLAISTLDTMLIDSTGTQNTINNTSKENNNYMKRQANNFVIKSLMEDDCKQLSELCPLPGVTATVS